jgi:DNA-binding Lrp family transcriptional regulator
MSLQLLNTTIHGSSDCHASYDMLKYKLIMSKPDSIDEQIVRLLGQDARRNSITLAKQLKLSAATVRRRIRILIRSRLLHIVGVIDPKDFGSPLAAVIALDVSHDKIRSALERLISQPEIIWLSTATGRYDILGYGRFRSTDHLSEFIAKELPQMEGLKDSETVICLELVKGCKITLT